MEQKTRVENYNSTPIWMFKQAPKNHTTILPIRPRRTQSNLGLPMVLSNATTYRLETRMDRSHPVTNHLSSPKCPESDIYSMYPKCTKTITPTRSLFHGKSNYW